MKSSVQVTFLSLLAFTLTMGAAHADFRPGRVRAGTVSDMRTVTAEGIFERNAGARVELNFEDGKIKPVSITLKMDNGSVLVLPIVKLSPSSCGDQYVAVSSNAHRSASIRLELTDYSNMKCRIYVAQKWHVAVAQNDANEVKSVWTLEGQPEELVGTLTTSR